MSSSSDYVKAYESAKKELADLISTQDTIEKRIVGLRKTLETLGALCESEKIQIQPSAEAAYLLQNSTLSQDIQAILKSHWPNWQRPNQIKAQLEHLGHDLSRYGNPQAAIHMVLKRMVESGDAQEDTSDEDGKQMYRFPPMWKSIADKMLVEPRGHYTGGMYKKMRK